MDAAGESRLKTWRKGPSSVFPWLSAALALSVGLGLRLWMLKHFFLADGDTLIYGAIAKNLLLHGQYALNGVGSEIYPTLIRLPGYPLFLALCFKIFGMENYVSAAWVQIALELAGCLLLADFAGRIAPPTLRRGSARCALWLAALCPLTAIYATKPMTESLTLFTLALALWSAERFRARPGWAPALSFTFAVAYAALLRPDGALVAVALAPALVFGLKRKDEEKPAVLKPMELPRLARMAAVCALLTLLPFAAWGWRNWQVFHVFQPLAPRLANDPGERTYPGWERWVKSWSLDFISTYNIYWSVPGEPLKMNKLPSRAFDSPAQYAETAALAADYNLKQELTPALDARFEHLAEERRAAHPLRTALWLPLGRMADMWLRPRVEDLPIELDWWAYARHKAETRFSWAYAGLNAFYLLLGIAGLCLRPRFWQPMLAYFLLRSALLTAIGAPEARYTLECFPMLFALGGVAVYRFMYVVFLSVFRVKASAGRD